MAICQSLGKLGQSYVRLEWTHGIGVVAQEVTDPWSKAHAFADHLEGVHGKEEQQGDGHAHEAFGGAIAFELGND